MLKIKRKKDHLSKTPTDKLYKQFFAQEKVKLKVLYPFLSTDQINGKIKQRWQALKMKDDTASSPSELFTPTKWNNRKSSPSGEKKTAKYCSSKFVWETPEHANKQNKQNIGQYPDKMYDNQSSPSSTGQKTNSNAGDNIRSAHSKDINNNSTNPMTLVGCDGSSQDTYDYDDDIDDDAVLIRRNFAINENISDHGDKPDEEEKENDSQSGFPDDNNNARPKNQPCNETAEVIFNNSKSTSNRGSEHISKSNKHINDNNINTVDSKKLRSHNFKTLDIKEETVANENDVEKSSSTIEERETLKVKSHNLYNTESSVQLSPKVSPAGRRIRSKSTKCSMLSPKLDEECSEGKSAKKKTPRKLKHSEEQEKDSSKNESHRLTRSNSKRDKDRNNNTLLPDAKSVGNKSVTKKVSRKDKKNKYKCNNNINDEDNNDENVTATLSNQDQSKGPRSIPKTKCFDPALSDNTPIISQIDCYCIAQKMTPSGDATSTNRNLKRKYDEEHDGETNLLEESDQDDDDQRVKALNVNEDDNISYSLKSSEIDDSPCNTDDEDQDEPIVKRTVRENSMLERILSNLRSTGRKNLSMSDHEQTSQSSILSYLSDENMADDDINVNDMFSDVVTPDEDCKEPYKTTRMVKQSVYSNEEDMNQQFEQLFQEDDMIFM
ncbi:hypothetical protein ACF0H5_010489 [Mactra antiquata]